MNLGISVYKFGGSSLKGIKEAKYVINRIREGLKFYKGIVVIVSARGNNTNRLSNLAKKYHGVIGDREFDALLSTGEQESAALIAMFLKYNGINAISLNSFQIGLISDENFFNARIKEIQGIDYIKYLLDSGIVPVITGFQGIDRKKNITTLGRGGSDTTAVAIANAIGAKNCVLFTDVGGVYTADPYLVKSAKLLEEVSYAEMVELAFGGAKVINFRALELAENYNVTLYVRSTFSGKKGTKICKESEMERIGVKGITYNKDMVNIFIGGINLKNNAALKILKELNNNNVNIEKIFQKMSFDRKEEMNIFVKKENINKATKIIERFSNDFDKVIYDPDVGIVSVVGSGLREEKGVVSKILELLSKKKIPIYMITTSEVKLTLIINAVDVEKSVLLLHEGLELYKL